MKKYMKYSKKIILVLVIAILTMCIYTYQRHLEKTLIKETNITYNITYKAPRELTKDEKLDIYFNDNNETYEFYANAFKINKDTLIEVLKNDEEIDLLNNEENLDLFIINYLLNLENTNKEYFDLSITPNNRSKDYIVGLINYYTKLYGIDFNIAAAIGEIESGYSAVGMLNVNNVFGGLASGRLLRYRTMEYGIIRYIKMLHDGYFAKGLTTVESIGYIYNPITTETGQKMANPNWVFNVKNAMNHYNDYVAINSINDLLNKNESNL